MAVDALGNPLRVILSPGQLPAIELAAALIKDSRTCFVVDNKSYDSDAFVAAVRVPGA